MKLDEAKYKFIQEWGVLGNNWGINRAMAQIQAILLLSPHSLTTDEIMEGLKMSRGNVNMNVRALIDWGLVFKEFKPGERKEYFYTEKDVWTIMKQVSKERRKREILPVKDMLAQIATTEVEDNEEGKEFTKITGEISLFINKMDGLLEKVSKSDKHWFLKILMKLVK
jgi:DNA-binding transcriptional regulator GbsR (MarR family)